MVLGRQKTVSLMFILVLLVILAGCGVTEKAKTLKDDLVNITMEQVAVQLQNSLNQQFPGVQVNTPQVLNSQGQVDWNNLKQTELGNYSFYTMGSYEFRAVLAGNGTFQVQRINNDTGETYNYAQFKVQRVDNKFVVTAE